MNLLACKIAIIAKKAFSVPKTIAMTVSVDIEKPIKV